MPMPSVETEIHRLSGTGVWRWCSPRSGGMRSVTVVIVLKIAKLGLQIGGRPEQRPVEKLAPHRADQALHKRMRERDARNRLDFGYVQDTKIGLPLMKPIQRIMIGTEVFGKVCL